MPTFMLPYLLFAIVMDLAALPAAARERPGTPSHASMSLVGPTTLRMTWINTRRVGPASDGQTEQTWFDVEGRTDTSRPEFGVNPIMGQSVTFDIAGLPPGQHCFRAWSRESPDGVRSAVPSAWACGTIPGPQRPSVAGTSPVYGAVLPEAGAIVWVAAPLYYRYRARTPSSVDEGQFVDSGVSEQRAGVILVTATAAKCPYPWRNVMYQYGGWPNLGPAGATTETAAYGLCWFTHVPSAAESIVPSPPVVLTHPVAGGGGCVPGRNCP